MGFVSILAGCLTTGPLMDTLGRKKTLLVANTPFIVGWLLLCLAPRPAPVALLYFARLLNGFGGGMVSSLLALSLPFLPSLFRLAAVSLARDSSGAVLRPKQEALSERQHMERL
jgi:MFS family permease